MVSIYPFSLLVFSLLSGCLLLSNPTGKEGVSLQMVRLAGKSAAIRFHWAVPAEGLVPPKLSDPSELDPVENAGDKMEWDCDVMVLKGRILQRNKVVDGFRFDFYPGNPAFENDPVWLVFERMVEPGVYILKLELFNCDGVLTRELSQTLVAEPYHDHAVDPPPELSNFPMASHSVRIVLPGNHLLVNKAKLEAVVLGDGVHKVRFLLDGVPVFESTAPPHEVTLNLKGPRMRTLRVEAVDGNGYLLAVDSMRLNQGPYAFSVRLLEPVEGRTYKGVVMARAEVKTPLDRALDKVVFTLGGKPVATLYNEPFTVTIPIPQKDRPQLLTARASLKNGREAVDTVVFNAPGIVESLKVREVELLVGVSDDSGKPVMNLKQEDFRVLEDGKPQKIQHFEVARNLPVNLMFLTDVSRSMFVSIPHVTSGSKRMIDAFIGPGDRAGIMVFQNRPRMLIPFTEDPKQLVVGLRRTIMEAETSEILGSGIYDSIAQALHYFGGIQGRRALLVFTDGEDNRSTYAVEDTLNFARQAEVRIYVIKQKRLWSADDEEEKEKDVLEQLTLESGGAFFRTESPHELFEALSNIARELRTQYLIRYQTIQNTGPGDCRPVKVELANKKLKARTMGFVCP